MRRVRGFGELVFDVVRGTVNLVERTHRDVARRSVKLYSPTEEVKAVAEQINEAHLAVASVVYGSIRVVNGGVRAATKLAAAAVPNALVADAAAGASRSAMVKNANWVVDQAQAAVNGWYGDVFDTQKHLLAMDMTLRNDGRAIALEASAIAAAYPNATSKVCVLVHGLCSTEWVWEMQSEAHYGDAELCLGARMTQTFGYTALHVRYNSGRAIAENGEELAAFVSELVRNYPVAIDDIVVIGHSMGGLVSKHAVHRAQVDRAPWLEKLKRVICVGSPHEGSALERFAEATERVFGVIPTAATSVAAELLKTRSRGIRDLYHGRSSQDDMVPLADHVDYHYIGATLTADTEHFVSQFVGDILVAPHSSMESKREAHRVTRDILGGIDHVSLANHPLTWGVIQSYLADSPRA